ncbi:hypothetical protein TSUD_108780 [Trifolium subterraneum]|nr:hypothetical protein TSUD_108780 [Trifolium subterraneum]
MPSLPPPLSALSLLPCACCLMSKYQANNRGSMAWRVNGGRFSNYHALCLVKLYDDNCPRNRGTTALWHKAWAALMMTVHHQCCQQWMSKIPP